MHRPPRHAIRPSAPPPAEHHRAGGVASLLSRVLLLIVVAQAAGCYEPAPDLLATLKGRFDGRWVVSPADRVRLPAGDVDREHLTLTISSREPLGDALVPGNTYARGTLAWGDRACSFALEYPIGSRDVCCAFVRYMAPSAAPFGAPDTAGFNLLLLTGGSRDDDGLCVDFARRAPAVGGIERMLHFVRAPDAE